MAVTFYRNSIRKKKLEARFQSTIEFIYGKPKPKPKNCCHGYGGMSLITSIFGVFLFLSSSSYGFTYIHSYNFYIDPFIKYNICNKAILVYKGSNIKFL
jgi:hypothetical protein